MRFEMPHPFLDPFLPQTHGAAASEALWMRSFAFARLSVLGLGLVMLPLVLIAPELAAPVLPVLLAMAAAAAFGLTGLRYSRPAEAIAMNAAGLTVLALGPWPAGLSGSAAALAVLALALDWLAAPRAVRQLRWLGAVLGLAAVVAMAAAALRGGVAPAPLPALALLIAPVMTLILGMRGAEAQALAATAQEPVMPLVSAGALAAEQAAVLVMDRGAQTLDQTVAAHRLLGEPLNGLAGREFVDRVLIADRPAFLKAVSDAIITGVATTLVLRIAVGDGPAGRPAPPRFAAFDVRIAPLAAGRTAAIVLSAAPVNEATPDRTQGNDDLFAALSHEVRTPMNAILGFSGMLANPATQPKSPAIIAEYAEIIHASANNAFAVSQALADLMRVDSPGFRLAPETVDIAALVSGLMASHASRVGRGRGRQTFDCQPENIEIEADPRALRILFGNLIEGLANAGGAAPEFSCRLASAEGRILLDMTCKPGGETAEPPRHEACLGLVETLARRLARLLGGDVTLTFDKTTLIAAVRLPVAGTLATLPVGSSPPFPSLRKSA